MNMECFRGNEFIKNLIWNVKKSELYPGVGKIFLYIYFCLNEDSNITRLHFALCKAITSAEVIGQVRGRKSQLGEE